MATVTFEETTRRYPGTAAPAVNALDLAVADGEFLVLVGPSGCGKSTSLRMLAGLEDVDEGAIRIGEQDVTHLPPKARDIAMVFQNYALYPHMSVAQNMGFALKIAGVDKQEIRRRVADAATLLELGDYLDRKPKALSGGQRQRVAMGRAIVREPRVFLMDEPLSNLDAKLRVSTRTQIASLQRRLGITAVYVTHDQVEAMTMGDRVCVLKDGELQQVDTPLALYSRPANVFVAGFIGSPSMNIGTFTVEDGHAVHGDAKLPLPRATVAAMADEGSDQVVLGFRPEGLEPAGSGEQGAFPITVDVVEELGSDAFVYGGVAATGGRAAEFRGDSLIVRVDPRNTPAKGQTLQVKISQGAQHCFSVSTGDRLPEGER